MWSSWTTDPAARRRASSGISLGATRGYGSLRAEATSRSHGTWGGTRPTPRYWPELTPTPSLWRGGWRTLSDRCAKESRIGPQVQWAGLTSRQVWWRTTTMRGRRRTIGDLPGPFSSRCRTLVERRLPSKRAANGRLVRSLAGVECRLGPPQAPGPWRLPRRIRPRRSGRPPPPHHVPGICSQGGVVSDRAVTDGAEIWPS